MYTKFFDFKEKPFNVTPDPKFRYLSSSHREALASMIYGINERKGFVLLVGEVGTGKTTMIHTILSQLDERTKAIYIFNTPRNFDELLRMSLTELGMPHQDKTRLDMLENLNTFLIDQLRKGNNVAMLIDEAQNLSYNTLEELRSLSNLETAKKKLIQIVLVGQPELDQKLRNSRLRQLKQRISTCSELAPLQGNEIEDYIDYRLKVAGNNKSKIFSSPAVRLIKQYSGGIPRKINVLCDNALLIGYATERRKIGREIVKEVIYDLKFEKPVPYRKKTVHQSPEVNIKAMRILIPAVVVLVIVAAFYTSFFVGNPLLSELTIGASNYYLSTKTEIADWWTSLPKGNVKNSKVVVREEELVKPVKEPEDSNNNSEPEDEVTKDYNQDGSLGELVKIDKMVENTGFEENKSVTVEANESKTNRKDKSLHSSKSVSPPQIDKKGLLDDPSPQVEARTVKQIQPTRKMTRERAYTKTDVTSNPSKEQSEIRSTPAQPNLSEEDKVSISQIGTFKTMQEAEAYASALKSRGYNIAVVPKFYPAGREEYNVVMWKQITD